MNKEVVFWSKDSLNYIFAFRSEDVKFTPEDENLGVAICYALASYKNGDYSLQEACNIIMNRVKVLYEN